MDDITMLYLPHHLILFGLFETLVITSDGQFTDKDSIKTFLRFQEVLYEITTSGELT